MKIKIILSLIFLTSGLYTTNAQIDSSLLKRVPKDTATKIMNMDAIYSRPFLKSSKLPVSLGGYMETNWQHLGTDGISEGHQFQFRRMSIFIASSISKRVKFLSEIEFENDPAELMEGNPPEIDIEYAAMDIEFQNLLNLRCGMILNPIGAFNQNHDGPKWEFTDRPIAMTQMLAATWSNAGFGLFGKKYSKNWMFGYEIYLTGGFNNSIIDNDKNKTYLPQAAESAARFATTESGEPLVTGKLAMRNSIVGELGLSYMGQSYNKFQQDGLIIDTKRNLNVLAVDFNTTLPKVKTFITAEFAWIFVEIPKTYTQNFGNKQKGGFMDIVQPILKKKMMGWDNAVLNLACRVEYIDWNIGKFRETKGNIAEDFWSIMPAISFRPTQQTVLRLNYRYQQVRDIVGNAPSITGGFIFGISTYF